MSFLNSLKNFVVRKKIAVSVGKTTLFDVRKKYLNFMSQNGHQLITSHPLVPKEDSTTLFVSSGMQPLIQFFFGKDHPSGKRVANSQRCIRTNDIEEVGDNRHTTFFEMLGNWSFGDYGKEKQINMFFDFLTKNVGIPAEKLYVTVFAGDEKNGIPKDGESAKIWQDIFKNAGVSNGTQHIGTEENGDNIGMEIGARIFYYNSKKNWWSRSGIPSEMPVGEIGGGDTEVFYRYDKYDMEWSGKSHPNTESGEFVEIGNSVFMEWVKESDGFKPLKNKNVDFGGGLERIVSAANNENDIFKIDVLQKIVSKIESVTNTKYDGNHFHYRVIADHLRAASFLIREGVLPSNTDQGYVLRKLLRRAIFNLQKLNSEVKIVDITPAVIEAYKMEFVDDEKNIESVINEEEQQFLKTLSRGERELNKILKSKNSISSGDAFILFSTYGFPFELTREIVEAKGYSLDIEAFEKANKKHKEQSRTLSAGSFKGGLGDDSEETVRYHSATHLLHRALKDVLGDHVVQRGSNITKERLRFDFSHPAKLTDEEKQKVEQLVNKLVDDGVLVTQKEMSRGEAVKSGAIGAFGDKYGDVVSVYEIGDYSKEFCGGPHVKNTSEIGHIKIKKEESVSKGVRRIKAVFV